MACCILIVAIIALLIFPFKKILNRNTPLTWQLSMTNQNNTKKPFSIKTRFQSFRYAINGLWFVLKYEHNAWLHLCAAIFVITMSFYFQIKPLEWLIIIITISLVLITETINTAIERLCDFLHPEKHPSIGIIKDIAAGAVLITAISAMIVGFIIFIPYIIKNNAVYDPLSSVCSAISGK